MVTLYEPRAYRDFSLTDRFHAFRVVVETSDLFIRASRPLHDIGEALTRECRKQIEAVIARRPDFMESLEPVEHETEDTPIARRMILAGRKAGTGPMAAVAGAVADHVGRGLSTYATEVIVENGGDIFIKTTAPIVVGLFAGESVLSGRIGLSLQPAMIPLGICTSTAAFGHSLSMGCADAATVVSKDVLLADAAATAMGNRIQGAADLRSAVEWAVSIPGIDGALAILGDGMAAIGEIELTPLDAPA